MCCVIFHTRQGEYTARKYRELPVVCRICFSFFGNLFFRGLCRRDKRFHSPLGYRLFRPGTGAVCQSASIPGTRAKEADTPHQQQDTGHPGFSPHSRGKTGPGPGCKIYTYAIIMYNRREKLVYTIKSKLYKHEEARKPPAILIGNNSRLYRPLARTKNYSGCKAACGTKSLAVSG